MVDIQTEGNINAKVTVFGASVIEPEEMLCSSLPKIGYSFEECTAIVEDYAPQNMMKNPDSANTAGSDDTDLIPVYFADNSPASILRAMISLFGGEFCTSTTNMTNCVNPEIGSAIVRIGEDDESLQLFCQSDGHRRLS